MSNATEQDLLAWQTLSRCCIKMMKHAHLQWQARVDGFCPILRKEIEFHSWGDTSTEAMANLLKEMSSHLNDPLIKAATGRCK